MKVHLPDNNGVTMIENTFIDQFMASASGDYVKIYLYLLRSAQSGRSDITIHQIADALGYTEADVRRSLGYWQRVRSLDLIYDDDGHLEDIRVLSSNASLSFSDRETPSKITEFRQTKNDSSNKNYLDELRRIIFVAEQYFGRPISQTEQETLLYFLDALAMDTDLVEYLLEYCISQGHTSIHYIEKVAQNWKAEGIVTADEARARGSAYQKNYFIIFRSLGIQSRLPTKAEILFMERWLKEYDMPMDIIEEACKRTILSIGKAQFSYTDSILRSWHENGAKNLSEVRKLDEAHETDMKKIQSRSSSRSLARGICNFSSTGSNWDELARQVVQSQSKPQKTVPRPSADQLDPRKEAALRKCASQSANSQADSTNDSLREASLRERVSQES